MEYELQKEIAKEWLKDNSPLIKKTMWQKKDNLLVEIVKDILPNYRSDYR